MHEDDSILEWFAPTQILIHHEDDSIFEWVAPTEIDSDEDITPTEIESDADIEGAVVDTAIEDAVVDIATEATMLVDASDHAVSPHPAAYSLCDLLGMSLQPDASPSLPVDSEPFDSQLTVNDNPNYERPLVPLRDHFTRNSSFYDDIHDAVKTYIDQGWFCIHDCINHLCPVWEGNCDVVTNAIRSIASTCTEFKIGITLDPRWRFFECAGGEYVKRFRKMTIVYVSTCSNKFRLHSTGMMERHQIAIFKEQTGCLNAAPGGEGASKGSPHFMYVVSN
jgi:hypothetical protein